MKYNNLGIGIEVPLPHTDYVVVGFANWNKETSVYNTKLYLYRKDVEDMHYIENFTYEAELKDAKFKLSTIISDKFRNKEFDQAISSYEYSQKAFDAGIELLETTEVA